MILFQINYVLLKLFRNEPLELKIW